MPQPADLRKAQFDAKVIAKVCPRLGRFIQRMLSNPRKYVGPDLLPYWQEAKALSNLAEISDEDWDALAMVASAFFALGFERSRRDQKKRSSDEQ